MTSQGADRPHDDVDRAGRPAGGGTVPPDGHRAVDVPPGPDVPEDVRGVVQTAVDALSRAGTASASAVTEALESAARRLSLRVVADAATHRHELVDEQRLRRALAARPAAPALASATTAAMALRFARRFRHLGFLAKRTPAFLLATAAPAAVAAVSRGSDELGMVAAHLVHRARADGVEPDVERVRRVAVQIVSRHPVDPDVEPSHGRLAWMWIRRAVRAALPFTSGVATADPDGLAHTAAAVDTSRLAAG
jgi:hypothetical protein